MPPHLNNATHSPLPHLKQFSAPPIPTTHTVHTCPTTHPISTPTCTAHSPLPRIPPHPKHEPTPIHNIPFLLIGQAHNQAAHQSHTPTTTHTRRHPHKHPHGHSHRHPQANPQRHTNKNSPTHQYRHPHTHLHRHPYSYRYRHSHTHPHNARNRHFHRHSHLSRHLRLYQKHLQNKNYIVNLSSKTLTPAQNMLLQKGLNYAHSHPHTPNYNKTLQRLTRHYRLRHYFRDEPDNTDRTIPPFKPPSTWNPPPASTLIETYLKSLPNRLASIPRQPHRPNLRKSERAALHELKSDHSLVIKKADKGSCIVVEDRRTYIQDGLRHLSDATIYEQIPSDPTHQLTIAINRYINTIHNKGYISHHMHQYLTHPDPAKVRTQQLYFLKKIHKDMHAVRPIVSGSSGPTEKLSSFVDYFLQPLVPLTNSYIKDSKSLITLLDSITFPPNITLVAIDVTALYLNIPHDEGIQATLTHLHERNPDADDIPFPPTVTKELLHIVLRHNYFEFNSNVYRQIQGTAMGTKMAPSYANLFMDILETNFLRDEPIQPLLWKRYIDDILCIWHDTPDTLDALLTRLNDAHPTIKFTSHTSTQQTTFLDLELYKGPTFTTTGKLDIRPHYKDTNAFQYLHHNSSHPRSTHRAIVKGEFTRALRASTDPHTFNASTTLLSTHFRRRKYTQALIREVLHEVPYHHRAHTLQEPPPPPAQQPPPFITLFAPTIPKSSLKSALDPQDPTIPTPRITYTRNNNTARHLVRARLPATPNPPISEEPIILKHLPSFKSHSAPCNTPLCKCCHHMSRKPRVFSSHTGRSFPTPQNTNCDTPNIIYLIECKRCTTRNQYIGQTSRPLKNRISGHRAAHIVGTRQPFLYKHFKKPLHSFHTDARITILAQPPRTELLHEEARWMHHLSTKFPHGLNSRFEQTALPPNLNLPPNSTSGTPSPSPSPLNLPPPHTPVINQPSQPHHPSTTPSRSSNSTLSLPPPPQTLPSHTSVINQPHHPPSTPPNPSNHTPTSRSTLIPRHPKQTSLHEQPSTPDTDPTPQTQT